MDRIFRIFEEENNKFIKILSYESNDIITSVAFSPDGSRVFLGDMKGKITKFIHTKEGLDFDVYFSCKNRFGKYSNGRKITNIEFVNKNYAYISTSDSRIRLVNMDYGDILVIYKGHTNLNLKNRIKGHFDEFNKILITTSEDNKIYIWNKEQQSSDKVIKNKNYRCFEPFKNSKLLDSYCLNEAAFNDF